MAHRVQNYEVKIINELREDKKLLVLDIDYTLFDHRTPAETGAELMRPHLHDFLTSAHKVRKQLHSRPENLKKDRPKKTREIK